MKKILSTTLTQSDGKITFALMTLLGIGIFFLAGGYFKITYSPKDPTLYSNPLPNNYSPRNNIQLEYLKFATNSGSGGSTISRGPLPTPDKPYCVKYTDLPRDNLNACICSEFILCKYKNPKKVCTSPPPGFISGREDAYCAWISYCDANLILCKNQGNQDCSYVDRDDMGSNGISYKQCNEDFNNNLCEIQCVAKPVIYFYTDQTRLINVKLEIPGIVTVSDPHYPDGGWKRVEAYPNPRGAIRYQGRDYPYLYYETAVQKPQIPTQGWVVKTDQLEAKLRELTTQLGLIEHEQTDFLEYWLPKLKSLNKPYVFITVLPQPEKEKVDKVVMSIKPETQIEMIFEFRPLDQFEVVQPLKLPTKPTRHGFTMVEWGGAINETVGDGR